MIYEQTPPAPSTLRAAVRAGYRADETATVKALIEEARLSSRSASRVAARAAALVAGVRSKKRNDWSDMFGLEAFLEEYDLSNPEGVSLMCVAEALLRVPDADTRDSLIEDKMARADWSRHVGQSDSMLVNASTWALMLTGRVMRLDEGDPHGLRRALGAVVKRGGEPVIRGAVAQAMRLMGANFVMGRTIEEALTRSKENEAQGYRHSFDMLGEAARTMKDAERYFDAYTKAIAAIGKASAGRGPIAGPGVSVKLSALHPRYEVMNRDRVMAEMLPRALKLAEAAKAQNIGFTVDAEEADRLDLSMDVIEALAMAPSLKGWDGFGLAIQAYGKRCPALIDWLDDLGARSKRVLMVRLVKGAYWDAEVKRAQVDGQTGYPVFTRKVSTDVSYLACAKRMIAAENIYPQFATHNAHSIAAVMEMAGTKPFEFQRLHGMGEPLYDQVVGGPRGRPCRIYAPVGPHRDLLAYLVRRLLENGANSSFVNRLSNDDLPIEEIVADPVSQAEALDPVPHARIPLPAGLFGEERANSMGLDLSDHGVLGALAQDMTAALAKEHRGGPIVGGAEPAREPVEVRNPANRDEVVGLAADATPDDVDDAISRALAAQTAWNAAGPEVRAAALDKAADLYEARIAEAMALCTREAGKILVDGVAEVREACDFLRFYAAEARRLFADGEIGGRGVFACVSPWNFPLAIFTGQVAAALAAGNAVIAKPAEQTPLIAAWAVRILHEAGVPADVLALTPGDGAKVGGRLTGDPRIAGVCFTGSTETARLILKTLSRREGTPPVFIAETGGQNAMIVDSTALAEQVAIDVIASSFQSAGQRCSALRVLFLQDVVADGMIDMIAGASKELIVGDPSLFRTDVGPVIDAEAKAGLDAHVARMDREARRIGGAKLTAECARGTFVAPAAFEIDSIARLEREVFGPVLHVVRWKADRIDQVCAAIEATGYGLTLGVHSRIDAFQKRVFEHTRAGNVYINRNQIGAVVGVQPFGGRGLSGTGPKAGGHHYLPRFAKPVATSRPAAGGGGANASSAAPDAKLVASCAKAAQAWAGVAPSLRIAAMARAAGDAGGVFGDNVAALIAAALREVETPHILPGPAGERNELSLRPRGLALVAGGDAGQVALGAIAALLAGDAVIAAGLDAKLGGRLSSEIAAVGKGLGDALKGVGALDAAATAKLASDAHVAVVIWAGAPEAAGSVAAALAGRPGPIIPLVLLAEELATPQALIGRLSEERTLSINTAAAGGDAALLSISSEAG